MAKEILLYHPIYEWTAEMFIKDIDDFMEKNEGQVSVRVNCEGGDPINGWGMIAKLQEVEDERDTMLKVDGKAHSWAAYLACCVAKVQALDVSTFAFHRAAYPSYIEQDASFPTSVFKTQLEETNKKLKKLLRTKVDVAKFEKYTKTSIDDLFSMDKRIDVMLTAKQALDCKLVSEIVSITAEKSREIAACVEMSMDAKFPGLKMAARIDEPKTETTMTLDELKDKHPAVYQACFNAGAKEGKEKERERIEAFMVFVEADPAGVKAGIEAGKDMTPKQMAEFTLKATSGEKLKDLGKNNNGAVKTEDGGVVIPAKTETTEKEKTIAAYYDEVKANLKLYAPKGVGGKEVAKV